MFPVNDGTAFRNSIEDHASGLPRFDEMLDAMIWQLERDPLIGERLMRGRPRFAIEMSVGTLDWKVMLHYSFDGESVLLIGIHPIRMN